MINSVIFGISSTSLTKEEKDLFHKVQPLGFILFKRNITDPDQLSNLVQDLKDSVDHEYVPILIDQEGGRVNRLKPPKFEPIKKPAKYFGDIAKTNLKEAEELTFINSFKIGKELSKYGINVDCAPVADLYYEEADDVIGDRSFSDDIDTVVALCNTSIKGFRASGVEAIIKHIPGHGRAEVDSHKKLPVIKAPLDELEQTDFKVFKNLTHAKWAMTAHAVYTEIDEKNPITQSKKGIEYIRNKIGYKNIIITDDINMKALKGGLDEITTKCYDAGCDIVLHCSGDINEMKLISKALKKLDDSKYELIQPPLFFELDKRFEEILIKQNEELNEPYKAHNI